MAKKKSKRKKSAKRKPAKRGKKGTWTSADISTLKKLFANNPTAVVAKKLGRSLDTVKKKASRMGLKKAKKYLKKIGRA